MAKRTHSRRRKRPHRQPNEISLGRYALGFAIITVAMWGATIAYFWHGRVYRHSVRMPVIVVGAEVLLLPITAYLISQWWRTRDRRTR